MSERNHTTGRDQVKQFDNAAELQRELEDYKLAAMAEAQLADERQARVDELKEALPDPEKLELLAAWLDAKYPNDSAPHVQADLRQWAKAARAALDAVEKP